MTEEPSRLHKDLLESSPHFDGKNDGIFTVELPEFMATFDCVYTTLPKVDTIPG